MLEVYQLNKDRGSYTDFLKDCTVTNPYFLYDYIDIFSAGTADLICFKYKTNSGEVILMPGYLHPITIEGEQTEFYDFTSPYGYTGPWYSEGIMQDDKADFWKAVDLWYIENNVITEFIRFNLTGNHKDYNGHVHPTMLNIRGRIVESEAQWNSFDHKVRKNVKKAIRENLYSKIYFDDITDVQTEEFHKIYIDTMQRTNAKSHFFYTLEQFKRFLDNNKKFAAICTVYFENTPVSSEFLLVSPDGVYSFLGGTDEKYFDKRPNDFLKYNVLNWARLLGKKYYVLGGGYGYQDGIFKYKKSFFPEGVVTYYTGRKLLNYKVYSTLLETSTINQSNVGSSENEEERAAYFPAYRKVGAEVEI